MLKRYLAFFALLALPFAASPQSSIPADSVPAKKDTVDALLILRRIFHAKEKANPPRFALLPAVGYNPSYGLTLGVNFTGIFQTAKDPDNRLSSVFFNPFWSSKNTLNVQLRQNIFFSKNKLYLIGNTQIARLASMSYAPGSDVEYPVNYQNLKVIQRLYRRISGNFYAGGGLAFEMFWKIEDENLDVPNNKFTPNYVYSKARNYNPEKYNANGFMLSLLYHSQEHPLRSYKGLFADLWVRFNQTWLGSTQNSALLYTDIRKYFSLSKKNPEHVLAFWELSAFNLGNDLPYLALPATGLDLYNRSGRAYAIGRFRGANYFYLESEYRFPISKRKLLSGIAFINMQTVSSEGTYKVFTKIHPSAGAGLRILINKRTRSNLCLDYAIGLDGQSGVFFGLNEVF